MMNYNIIKRILLNSVVGALLCNYCIFSQDCDEGYTYIEILPEQYFANINNDSFCFSNNDLAVLNDIILINELNYDSPLEFGPQTWSTGRLNILAATYSPSPSSGITQKIDQLPDNIGQLSELTSLFLEKHDLTELPDSFTLLSNLKILKISNNWLISLPQDFGSDTSLVVLDLGYNQLESIPESIGGLINIQYLWIFNNQLTSLPETICDLPLNWEGIDPANYPYFGSGGNYLCDCDLIPDCAESSPNLNTSMEQNYYSFLLDEPQICSDECGCYILGDLNYDFAFDVLDVVTLANCVLADDCAEIEWPCAADVNGDGGYNVLDIVTLANCVLGQNCSG